MEEREDPANPHLVDIFKTLLSQCQPTQEGPPGGLVVRGSRNIIVCGGNVYLGAPAKHHEVSE